MKSLVNVGRIVFGQRLLRTGAPGPADIGGRPATTVNKMADRLHVGFDPYIPVTVKGGSEDQGVRIVSNNLSMILHILTEINALSRTGPWTLTDLLAAVGKIVETVGGEHFVETKGSLGGRMGFSIVVVAGKKPNFPGNPPGSGRAVKDQIEQHLGSGVLERRGEHDWRHPALEPPKYNEPQILTTPIVASQTLQPSGCEANLSVPPIEIFTNDTFRILPDRLGPNNFEKLYLILAADTNWNRKLKKLDQLLASCR